MAGVNLTQVGVVIIITALAILYELELEYNPLIVQRSAVVARSPNDVYKFVSDVMEYPQWTGLVQHVEPLDNSAFGIGKSFYLYMTVPTGVNRYYTLVRSYEPNSTVSFDLDMNLLQPIVAFEIDTETKPGVSKVTMSVYTQRRSYLFKKCNICDKSASGKYILKLDDLLIPGDDNFTTVQNPHHRSPPGGAVSYEVIDAAVTNNTVKNTRKFCRCMVDVFSVQT